MDRFDHEFRRLDSGDDDIRDHPAQIGALLIGEKAALAEAGVIGDLLEARGVEFAIRALERLFRREQALGGVVADRQSELTRFLIQRDFGDQTLQNLQVQPRLMRLLVGDRAPHPLLNASKLVLISGAVGFDGDFAASDAGEPL